MFNYVYMTQNDVFVKKNVRDRPRLSSNIPQTQGGKRTRAVKGPGLEQMWWRCMHSVTVFISLQSFQISLDITGLQATNGKKW